MDKIKRFTIFYSFIVLMFLVVSKMYFFPFFSEKIADLYNEQRVLSSQVIEPSIREEVLERFEKPQSEETSEQFRYINEEDFVPLTEEEEAFNQQLEKEIHVFDKKIMAMHKKEDLTFLLVVVLTIPIFIASNLYFYRTTKKEDVKLPTKIIFFLIHLISLVSSVFEKEPILLLANTLIIIVFILSRNIQKVLLFTLYCFFVCLLPFLILPY